MAGRIKAFIMEASGNIAGKYGNGWMRLNRSGNHKDTINVLPEEVKLSELAKTDIKNVKLDILNDYFGRTVITPQGNLARIILKTHNDINNDSDPVKPKFLYSMDAATGREVKDTENFKTGTGFVFTDNPETKVRATFAEETVGEGKTKVTYHGFNRARYKNVKKQLYPMWTCDVDGSARTMVFIARKDGERAYSDIVFYRVNDSQSRADFVQLDGNTNAISSTYYWIEFQEDDLFHIDDKKYIAIYQPEMSIIRAGNGELTPLNTSSNPSGRYIPAPDNDTAQLMYNNIVGYHRLPTQAAINEYTPLGGQLPNGPSETVDLFWTDTTGRPSVIHLDVLIVSSHYIPDKLGLKTADEWKVITEEYSLYDNTPIWLAEIIVPFNSGLTKLYEDDGSGGKSNEPFFTLPTGSSEFLLRIPCRPVSGPISNDPDNYFGFVPINDQYLEIANGPQLWHGPLRTDSGEITRVASEAKQLKGKATFAEDPLGFMGVIYRGLVEDRIGARKWLEWQVNLWLTTYMKRTNRINGGGISDVKCELATPDGIGYKGFMEYKTATGTETKLIDYFINLDNIKVVYHKDMAAYRDNGFKQRDAFIDTVNLNNVNEVANALTYLGGIHLSETGIVPNKEYWMKYIIPRLKYNELYMRVGVMTDGENLRPTYGYQDIPLHGFLHTGLSFLNRIPENNPDNRKADAIYAMYNINTVLTQRTEYLHAEVPHYANGSRGFENSAVDYLRLPANTNANSIVARYNFDSRNPNATYLAQGDGWGFTGNVDKDNWHRGNLHSLVNFEPAPKARLFRDKPIYTMIPWENAQVDYQYIRGYLHGNVKRADKLMEYASNIGRINGDHGNDVVLGGYFPCLSADYFKINYNYEPYAPPPLRHGVSGICDIAPLVRVASQSPVIPHEWKPYEGNVNELIDGASSTMIENPLYDYTNLNAWYNMAFDQHERNARQYNGLPYQFNKKNHPITTYDHHIDGITLNDGVGGLINQFKLPNQDRENNIYSGDPRRNPRYHSILYTRRRAIKLGLGATYGTRIEPFSVHDLGEIGSNPAIYNSPQSWLITVGLDIMIEHAKRLTGRPKDLKDALKRIFDKHGIPESRWLPQWEQGPEVFFLENEIWLDYFFASAKIIPRDVKYEVGEWTACMSGEVVERGVNVEDDPGSLYRVNIDHA